MAPPKITTVRKQNKNSAGNLQQFYVKYVNLKYAKYLFFDPNALSIVTALILLTELFLNLIVILRVPYTEIDWKAYMQECEGFLNGTTNYALLRGDTGPLVYPAAFVYIYSGLYFITSQGQNVRLAQYVFMGIYLLQMWLVLRLYAKSRKVPPFVLIFSAFTSYRVHSIYVLRLFNDPLAILCAYAALNLFLDRHFTLGSICFSLGVGIKMNILLFAPALLLFYLTNLGIWHTIVQLAVCGCIQIILGVPFLFTYPWEYLKGSFDLGRVFEHKWTVNYRFMERALFEEKTFHLSLLVTHLVLLLIFAMPTYVFFKSYFNLRVLQEQLQPQLDKQNIELKKEILKKLKKKEKREKHHEELTKQQEEFLQSFEKNLQKATRKNTPAPPEDIEEPEVNEGVSIHFDQCTQLALLPFFISNFIGIVCARSLHYQFYVWYYHSLPYLVYSTNFGLWWRFLILGLLELCWNTYPSTNWSSALLHICHLLLLGGLLHYCYGTLKTLNKARKMQKIQQMKSQ